MEQNRIYKVLQAVLVQESFRPQGPIDGQWRPEDQRAWEDFCDVRLGIPRPLSCEVPTSLAGFPSALVARDSYVAALDHYQGEDDGEFVPAVEEEPVTAEAVPDESSVAEPVAEEPAVEDDEDDDELSVEEDDEEDYQQ